HGHGHEHGHSHGDEHAVVPVRYVVLVLPVALFLLGLPSPAFVQAFHDHLMQIELGKLGPADHAAGLVDLPGWSVVGMRIDKGENEGELNVIRVSMDGAAEKAGIKV